MSALDDARLADVIEAEAWAALFAVMPPPMRAHAGARVERVRGAALLVAPGIPTPYFNRAIGLGLEGDVTEDDVAAIADAFARAGSKASNIHLAPYARSRSGGVDEVRGWLRARGYAPMSARPRWAKFLRGAEAPPAFACSLEVRKATPADAEPLAKALVAAHDMPPPMAAWTAAMVGAPHVTMFALTDAGAIVGGGLLYARGEHAWLGLGGTLASHRGRGGQKAIMAKRIAHAAELGATSIATETGEPVGDEPNPSFENMRKAGFRIVAARENWVRAS